MNCNEIKYGTFECAYFIKLPYKYNSCFIDNGKLEDKYVAIDKCLLRELLDLWELGIRTTGCCCGHGNPSKPYIGVEEKFIPMMKELGYVVRFNQCRPNDEDSFIPKTELKYE